MCRTLFQAQIIRALHPVNLYLERQTTQSFSECSVPACFLKIPFCGDVLCLKSFIQAVVGWMSTKASERQGTVLCLYSFSTIYFRHFRSLLLQMPFNPLICRMDTPLSCIFLYFVLFGSHSDFPRQRSIPCHAFSLSVLSRIIHLL